MAHDAGGNQPAVLYQPGTTTPGNVTDLGAIITANAVTSTQTSPDQTNFNGRGIMVVLNITTLTGTTPTLTLEIDGKDGASGQYFAQLTGTALSAAGTTVYRIYPGLTAAANLIASDVLPRTWRVKVTAGGTITNATFTVGAILIP